MPISSPERSSKSSANSMSPPLLLILFDMSGLFLFSVYLSFGSAMIGIAYSPLAGPLVRTRGDKHDRTRPHVGAHRRHLLQNFRARHRRPKGLTSGRLPDSPPRRRSVRCHFPVASETRAADRFDVDSLSLLIYLFTPLHLPLISSIDRGIFVRARLMQRAFAA